MYAYTEFDRNAVRQRAAQFRDQLERHLKGELGADEFKPLRLQNGWYVQRYAPMLRVAVPYGEIRSDQLRALARIARELFSSLDAPVGRIGALDTWVGYAPSLENEILPQVENIVAEAQNILAY